MKLLCASAFLTLLFFNAAGCSRQAVYESLRHTSNQVNADNPNYNPDALPSYDEYEARRKLYMEDLQEKQ
jgi:hypothetical protein